MKHRLRTVRQASADIDGIVRWLAVDRQSPQGASNWLGAYEKAAELVRNRPQSYGLAPEYEESDRPLRQFLFKTRRGRTYRGLFVMEGDEILVVRVLGPGQQYLPPHELNN